jgi:hypothetical protein
MKLYQLIFSAFLSLASVATLAEVAISPQHRIQIWTGQYAIPDSEYTFGSTTAMGTVKTLKSTPMVLDFLTTRRIVRGETGELDLTREPGAKLHSKPWNNIEHQSVSDKGTYDSNGTSRQCVAFARSMTGTKKSTYWRPGTALLSYVEWNGLGYVPTSTANLLKPGTMIAHFRGKDRYPTSVPPWGHVSIFLSWSYDTMGYIDGINVVDQNLTESINVNGTIVDNASGLIQVHKLPWACNAGKSCGSGKYFITFFSSGYHVVDVI